jgi:hypothetical protein
MSDWWSVLAIFWIAYLFDGLRRTPRAHTIVRRAAPWTAVLRHAGLHLLPPAPWAWRFRADDPPFALSPEGLCNQPVGTAARPAEPAQFTAVWRWEQIETVEEKRGWLVVNGRLFGPAATAWPAAELLALAAALKPLAPAAREARLRRWLSSRLRPAHWRRRMAVVRRRTGDAALLNSAALLACAAATAIACFTPATEDYEETPRILALLPPLLWFALAAYAGGIAAALYAARRLRRWLQPGTTKAILSAACFPPHGLRWRRLLSDSVVPAPHPLLLALAAPGTATRAAAAFDALADTLWPLPLPELAPAATTRAEPLPAAATPALATAAAIRTWQAAEFERRFRNWFAAGGIDAAALIAPPARDNSGACAYCPRCRSQFSRADGRCPHGIPLQPLPPR